MKAWSGPLVLGLYSWEVPDVGGKYDRLTDVTSAARPLSWSNVMGSYN
jgi:hypothetical protein